MSNGSSTADQSDEYAGQRLGLPESGVDSLASVMRRAGGVFIDWSLTALVVLLVFRQDYTTSAQSWTLIGWVVMGIVCVWLFSFTPGQLLLGMRVVRVGANERVSLWRAAVRSLLLVFVVPAFFVDRDGRGLHDQLSGTGVVRTR